MTRCNGHVGIDDHELNKKRKCKLGRTKLGYDTIPNQW